MKAFGSSIGAYKKDKWITILSIIPVVIGTLFFTIAGNLAYTKSLAYGDSLIKQYITNDSVNGILYYVLVVIFTIILYFLVSYTFVLVVSIFASPFNDMISTRVENVLMGKEIEPIGASFKTSFSKVSYIIFNEIKKVIFILIVSLISVLLSLFPIFSLVSLLLSAILLSVSFLDYSWSRHLLSFRQCLSDLRGNLFGYSIAGGGFLFLISIPIVNIIAYSFGVNYFTCLFTEKNREKIRNLEKNSEVEKSHEEVPTAH
jgi:CysZ protein